MSYETIKEQLSQPFDINDLDFRAGSRGVALVYVDVRAYQKRLDEVAPGDWKEGAPTLLAQATVSENALVSVVVPLTISGRTEYGVSDFKTPTGARAQAFKRAAANHGLGAYLYDAPELTDAYQSGKLVVDKSALIAECYRAWGLELPEGFQVQKPARSQQQAPARQQAQSTGDKVGGFTSKQVYKLTQLGLSGDEIKAIPWKSSRDVMDRVFAGDIDADGIRDEYLAAAAPARPSGRARW